MIKIPQIVQGREYAVYQKDHPTDIQSHHACILWSKSFGSA